jgi:hypothetical protein
MPNNDVTVTTFELLLFVTKSATCGHYSYGTTYCVWMLEACAADYPSVAWLIKASAASSLYYLTSHQSRLLAIFRELLHFPFYIFLV